MNKTVKNTIHFFHDKPLFGLDIGHGSLKAMQVGINMSKPSSQDKKRLNNAKTNRIPKLIGYGTANFDKTALEDGIVVQPDVVAKAARDLFKGHLIGDVTTQRAAITIPSYRTFTRSISLPPLKPKEIEEAVRTEAEQYIPEPLDSLYLDYSIIRQTKESTELFAVAVPKKIVDSYLELSEVLGLDVVLIETTMASAARLFAQDRQSDVPSVIIDFGSLSADISIFDKTILVTGTVQGGGEVFTNLIQEKLGVTAQEAGIIKTKYGLGYSKKQKEITEVLDPLLQQIVKEIRRMIRYYEERYGTDRPISQIITLGGGANMPGLAEYFTSALRVAVRRCEPWQYFDYKGLQPPSDADKPMYATVAGLSLANPREVFGHD